MSLFRRLISSTELRQPDGKPASFLVNRDLLPVPPEERQWTAINYWAFWCADSVNLSTFMIASSGISLGLSWWQCWLAVWVGYGIAAVFLVLNAYAGAVLHIIFPAYIRASFGVLGGLWPALNRAFMACVWYGVQSWIGGTCIYTFLLAIFPSLARLPNGIPSSGTDTAHFLCFFLFSLVSLVPIYFPMHKIRHLFTLKAIVSPIAAIALFAICIHKAHGGGSLLKQPASITGSTLGWAFVAQVMSNLSNMATLITNAIDFSSRASKPSDVVVPQLVAMPFCFALTSLFGIFIGSSSQVIFGEFVWSPLDVMTKLLTVEGGASHGMRAGVAFISLGFIVAQLGTNIAANALSAGCDLTSIFPRFINIRRGGYIAALVGFAMCPWNLLSSSTNFSTYLSAYSVFLSSIVGVMIAHYYLVARRRVKVADLYSLERDSIYRYMYGFNLRAFAAYIAGILINVVGFAGAIGRTVPYAAQRIYDLSFLCGFSVSALVYILLCYFFPVPVPTDAEMLEQPAALEGRVESRKDGEASMYEEEKKEVEGTASVELV
ncbi:uracil permease [Rhodotorula toruloides]